ncbi:SRPBCC family protein [Myxococcus sp. K15C18031901]|uniref:SRPBCC family protein n=1 Tax=Myxococcus dinghuensis TaxID=2906761 RepID=UPI0020A704C9|nr:SRPBCC family protein [Myxococcus dinghuensis]MCP3098028.1 SRPBCC family protein [Myxococcus dinghuensis]
MKKLAGVSIVAVMAGLVAIVGTRPDTFRIERSESIAAPPEVVFTLVNDFHHWDRWSPWWKVEPSQLVTLGETTSGVGATYEWRGTRTGSGRMEIVESRPLEYVRIRLDFTDPMHATNTSEYRLEPAPGGVLLTWVMCGRNTFVDKALSFFADQDASMGRDFEQGLADIKRVAEAESPRGAAHRSVPGSSRSLGGGGSLAPVDEVGEVLVTRSAAPPSHRSWSGSR